MWWILGAVLLAILGGAAYMLKITLPIADRVYKEHLVKTSPDKWGRVCSAPDNEEQVAMWENGCAWAEENKGFMQEVETENEGLHLYGEYYRFNDTNRCAIILPGRAECLKYSYYFAQTYAKAGWNVLCIDPRAHGKSDGTYNTIGQAESRDLLAWVKLLEEQFGICEIYLHTICVGTSTAMIAMTRNDCPDSIKGLVTEGCFVSFRETFRQHMIVDKRPLFPVLDLVMYNIRKHTGTNLRKTAPIRLVKNMKHRVLFIYGKQDLFSIPPMSRKLFHACASKDKQIHWFDIGCHSHLRINNTEAYDQVVAEFING